MKNYYRDAMTLRSRWCCFSGVGTLIEVVEEIDKALFLVKKRSKNFCHLLEDVYYSVITYIDMKNSQSKQNGYK